MKVVTAILAIFILGASIAAPICPEGCPSECQIKAAKETLAALSKTIDSIENNLQLITTPGCCPSVAAGTAMQDAYFTELYEMAAILKLSLGIPNAYQQVHQEGSEKRPVASGDCVPSCSYECAMKGVTQLRQKLHAIDSLLALECLAGACEAVVAAIAGIADSFGESVAAIGTFTGMCNSPDICSGN